MRLKDKVVLITGGANNIGRGLALGMAREGARIMIADADVLGARDALSLLQDVTDECDWVRTDIHHEDQIVRMRDATLRAFGRVDVLVNNVGGGRCTDPLSAMPADEWDRTFHLNVGQTFLCCRHILPEMIRTGGGSIINTASMYAVVTGSASLTYSPAKAGLVNLVRHIAMYYGRHGIRANCVCPGHVLMPATRAEYERSDQGLSSRYPVGRFCTIDDLVEAYVYLASDRSAYVTGTVLMLDGGYTAQ